MSTITKEWLQQAINDYESVRDELPFGLDDYQGNILEALRITLASLEAKAVAWRCDSGSIANRRVVTVSEVVAESWSEKGMDVSPLYTAPPLPVAVPTFDEWCERTEQKPVVWVRDAMKEAYDGFRAAMLQGAEPVSQPSKLPDGYCIMPMKLTAENGAKCALSGEFSETKFINCPECFGDDECETCDGSGRIEISVPVSWTTIKQIWAKGVEHFAASPQQEVKS